MLAGRGRVDEAIAHYREALELKPDYGLAHYNLGIAIASRGRVDEAVAHYEEALKIVPNDVNIRRSLEAAQSEQEKILTALARRRELLRTNPKDATLLNNTAWLLATDPNASVRNGPEAVELARRAVKLSDGNRAEILATLAAAYAEAGRFADAVQTAHKALDLATQQNKRALAESTRAKIRLYEAGAPFRESASSLAKTSVQP